MVDSNIISKGINFLNKKSFLLKSSKNPLPAKKVLLVDDQIVNLKIGQRTIEKAVGSVNVDTARNGKIALEKAQDNPYDLIIMDIEMPVMDGFDCVKNIREFDKRTPIISYTSKISLSSRQRALECGVDDYIVKPMSNRKLLRTVNKWLRQDIKELTKNTISQDLIAQTIAGKRFLIADDDPFNLQILEKILTKNRAIVKKVNNGQELIEEYHQSLEQGNDIYDAIITDINMPILKGDAAANKIRYNEIINEDKDPLIIISFSSDNQPEEVHHFLKKGMDGHFVKGDDSNNLLQILTFWLTIHDNKNNYNNKTEEDISKESQIKDNVDNTNLSNGEEYKSYQIFNNKFSNKELKSYRNIFLKNSEDLIKSIDKAYKVKDISKLSFTSHALKGISGNIGAQRLFTIVSYANNYFRCGYWPDDRNWFVNLNDVYQETISFLRSL